MIFSKGLSDALVGRTQAVEEADCSLSVDDNGRLDNVSKGFRLATEAIKKGMDVYWGEALSVDGGSYVTAFIIAASEEEAINRVSLWAIDKEGQ